MTTTLFSWGYYGWGNHTRDLIEAADAVEASRGFRPPVFVDTRIRRSVRAVGFNGPAFERLLGPDRHRWIKALGNRRIVTREGPPIQIADPQAVHTLLDLAIASAEQNRRVIYFCGCQWPRCDGRISCHRAAIAELCVEAARRRKEPIEVVEWPGGEPRQVELEVTTAVLAAVEKGRTTFPLASKPALAEIAGLPWYSIATLAASHDRLRCLVGPAKRKKGQWEVPVLRPLNRTDAAAADDAGASVAFRKSLGLEPLFSSRERD